MTYLDKLRAENPEWGEEKIAEYVYLWCPIDPRTEVCVTCPQKGMLIPRGDHRAICRACWQMEMPVDTNSTDSALDAESERNDSEKGIRGSDDMTAEREGAILEAALETWGETAQAIKALEELSELQALLAKWACSEMVKGFSPRRRDPAMLRAAIREELADAYIMLGQMELIFGDVSEEEKAKLRRLEADVKHWQNEEN